MQRETTVKGRGLGGSSDLTLLAPLKPGFAEALDSVTFKTRTHRVLDALHGARVLSHEYATARFLSDSVERVGVIHSVRVAVLEPENKVLLAVTFDGPWETYLRVLWDKVGTLLDLIFIDTVDYVTAFDHSFEEWRAWGRRVQVRTGFFYGPAESTARDARYWRRVERMRERLGADLVDRPSGRCPVDAARLAAYQADQRAQWRAALPSAEEEVERFIAARDTDSVDDPVHAPVSQGRMTREVIRFGLHGLAALYRLTDLYRPGTREGEVLRHAARDILREFIAACALARDAIREARDGPNLALPGQGRFARQLAWLLPETEPPRLRPPAPPRPDGAPLGAALLGRLQGGIVRSYDGVTHGLVVFVAFADRAGAARFATWTEARATRGDHPAASPGAEPFCNVAYTLDGLRASGLDENELELFPEEFRVGMAARAGALGDVRNHHPLRWRMPPAPGSGGPGADPAATHAAVVLRCMTAPDSPADRAVALGDPDHPLQAAFAAIEALLGVRVVSVQSMKRRFADAQRTRIVEHFGFVDGNGQPEIEAGAPRFDQNLIHLGEVLVGQANASDPAAIDAIDAPAEVQARMGWLGNGSFLVMRKYRQYVARLQAVVDAVATGQIDATVPEPGELVLAKMMGRWRDGTPVIDPSPGKARNNFTYDVAEPGACPVQAHIRLANPRAPVASAARIPRLMRRSMSYGPAFDAATAGDEVDRGIVFMSFSASIAEQYEVVQRWLNGGNPTGASSGQGCPFIGVPDNGVQKTFRFEYALPGDPGATRLAQVDLDPTARLFEEPSTPTRLEWGVYLFAPSIAVLGRLARSAAQAAHVRAVPVPWKTSHGREIIAALRRVEATEGAGAALDAWKAAIEDPEAVDRLDAAALWAAIRADHGGVLRTPYGTLVASRELLTSVLRDRDERYSMSGGLARMQRSFGPIALGLDAGPEYWMQADPVNDAIHALTAPPHEGRVHDLAFRTARDRIAHLVSEAQAQSRLVGDSRFAVDFDVREVLDDVLATLSEAWFGLQQAPDLLARGAVDWQWRPGARPLYPGHYTALSRYLFQPNPGPLPVELGEAYGQALHAALRTFVGRFRPDRADPAGWRTPLAPDGTPAPLAAAIFGHPQLGADDDFVARTVVGVMMGYTPTVIGAVLNVLREWFVAGRFGSLRAQLGGRVDLKSVREVVLGPMTAAARMRPMPQLAWRTVRTAHALGDVDLAVGDKVVLALVSGTQQSLADRQDEGDAARLMFGGARTWDGQRDHPTHACPGHAAGIEAMLGTLGALLGHPFLVRNAGSPTAFSVEGDTPAAPAPATPGATRLAAFGLVRELQLRADGGTRPGLRADLEGGVPPAAIRPPPSGRSGLVVGWGDSWLDYRIERGIAGINLGKDVRDQLESFGYVAPKTFCAWETWPTIRKMTDGVDAFGDWLTGQVQTRPGTPLRAVVLSAGGNDVTGLTLAGLLRPWQPGAPTAFDGARLDACMDALEQDYRRVVQAVLARLDRLAQDGSLPAATVPVVLHGYDYPYPVGKPLFGYSLQTWLVEPFEHAGYDLAQPAVRAAAVAALRVLMERFRDTLARVATAFPGRVRRVDLLGTVEACWPAEPQAHWANDLHPADDAFLQLALRIDDAVVAAHWP